MLHLVGFLLTLNYDGRNHELKKIVCLFFVASYLTFVVQEYRGAKKVLSPTRKGNKLTFLSEWCEFPSAPCLAGGGGNNLTTARVSRLLKSRASLTCF